MKNALLSIAIVIGLSTIAPAKVVTLIINNQPLNGPIILSSSVSIGTNEVATITSMHSPNFDGSLVIVKDGVTNQLSYRLDLYNYQYVRPYVIAGPATFILGQGSSPTGPCHVTLEIAPESFPPDKTIILPAGTVGVIHVESSTNLIQWQVEWVQTFANTNENRFFRLRAERSLP